MVASRDPQRYSSVGVLGCNKDSTSSNTKLIEHSADAARPVSRNTFLPSPAAYYIDGTMPHGPWTWSPLQLAIYVQASEAFQVIFNYKALDKKVVREALRFAVWNGAIGIVKWLIEYVPDLGLNELDNHGCRALFYYVTGRFEGYVEITDMLLLAGADPQLEVSRRDGPLLHFACSRGQFRLASFVVQRTSNFGIF